MRLADRFPLAELRRPAEWKDGRATMDREVFAWRYDSDVVSQ
jgi:hypothetical protein